MKSQKYFCFLSIPHKNKKKVIFKLGRSALFITDPIGSNFGERKKKGHFLTKTFSSALCLSLGKFYVYHDSPTLVALRKLYSNLYHFFSIHPILTLLP